MRTSRRGLFGLIAGATAAATLPLKAIPQRAPLKLWRSRRAPHDGFSYAEVASYDGRITSINITSSGSGYTSSPVVTLTR